MTWQKIKTDALVGLGRIYAKLPLAFILKSGALLGYLTWLVPNKRKKIAARNIQLCFPELSAEDKRALLKNNLISTGIGFAEMLVAFWSSDKKISGNVEFSGLEHVEKALSENKGCIFLSCHLHPLELATRFINSAISKKAHVLARQHNNKIFEAYVDEARKQHCEKTIDKKDVKAVLKSLKNNHPVYYIPDQNFSFQCEYIDFFGQPAATVIAPVRLAQVSKSPVIPWFGVRVKNLKGKTRWKIQFQQPQVYFQDKDINSSLKKMNQLFENQIKKHPEQYLWVHRRFKNHPKGKNYLYTDI